MEEEEGVVVVVFLVRFDLFQVCELEEVLVGIVRGGWYLFYNKIILLNIRRMKIKNK